MYFCQPNHKWSKKTDGTEHVIGSFKTRSSLVLYVRLCRRAILITPLSIPSILHPPKYSQCHAISKTTPIFSLALLLPVVVSFKRYNRQFYVKLTKKTNTSKKALSDSVFVNLRPLYNSNVAKVSFVLWSQNLIFVAISVISSIQFFLEIALLM